MSCHDAACKDPWSGIRMCNLRHQHVTYVRPNERDDVSHHFSVLDPGLIPNIESNKQISTWKLKCCTTAESNCTYLLIDSIVKEKAKGPLKWRCVTSLVWYELSQRRYATRGSSSRDNLSYWQRFSLFQLDTESPLLSWYKLKGGFAAPPPKPD